MRNKPILFTTIILVMMALTINQASATPVFQDNFDRPDNATVGGNWTEITGTDWEISNSTLYYNELPSSAQDEIVLTNPIATGNYDGFQITTLGSQLLRDFQIYVRALSNNSVHTIRWTTNSTLIEYYNGSAIRTCADFQVKEGDWIFINKTGSKQVIVNRQGNTTNLCNATSTYNSTFLGAYKIYLSITHSGSGSSINLGSVCSADTMEECIPGCTIDNECGTCQYCNSGTCNNQTNAQDLKNECSSSTSCTNTYTYGTTNGLCNGLGNCSTTITDNNITSGNVCINSTDYDVNPTSGVNCAVWYDCVTNFTTANEYLTGYTGDSTPTCTATDWQYTGGNYTTPSGYGINETSQGLNCTITLLPECNVNADCGTCEWCNGTICQNQTSIQDLKNECTANYNCINPYTYSDGTDFCNGAGSCASTQNYNVTAGNVCINTTSYDSDPQSAGNCAIWYDCITNMTTANEYYTGYTGNGNPTCTTFDWQLTGGSLIAPNGSYINQTNQGLTCMIYTPITDIFDYNQNDLAPSLIDAIGGILAGLAKTAIIIGLVAGLVLFVYLFTIGTEKLAPINRKK